MQGELVSRYLTAAAAIKRRLRFRGGLPMGLLPTTCHPGSRGGDGGGGGGGGRLKSVRETSAVEARNGDTATRRDGHICRRPSAVAVAFAVAVAVAAVTVTIAAKLSA
ncbi:hypothetical protein HZH68_015588 [Vespula germanica]|uniref:Uncharacterized protein n=1 Tax=Vespula germanica TaxID=30212 RepID=A0A834J566_VESGE|nr:hypothetical protein HZH68_015588 [Vespula germanica]